MLSFLKQNPKDLIGLRLPLFHRDIKAAKVLFVF